VNFSEAKLDLAEVEQYVPNLYETRYLPIEEAMIYAAYAEYSPIEPRHVTGRFILIRELDRSRDLAYACEVRLTREGHPYDVGAFGLLDMRELTKRPQWAPLLGWKSCKFDDAVEIARRKIGELGSLPEISSLFG
jgi:hypothetical protein